MCLLLVRVENINCIAVDWEDGAKCTYFIAASNTRVLGAEIAYLIDTFTKIYKYCPSKVHLIGHSLGAHTAGEAGRRLRGVDRKFPGIGRITGLDPAALCFEGMPRMVRLDPSDAILVDVIHSNAGLSLTTGFGMFNATGDMDFYPNGGTTMPGCNYLLRPRTEDKLETFLEGKPVCVTLQHLLVMRWWRAILVDVIHSNAGLSLTTGFGMFNATGDMDFYPNGGTTMPGCNYLLRPRTEDKLETFLEVTRGTGNCDHSRSHEYFRYSILCPDGFIGYPCESYQTFKEGKCFPCPKEGCPMMGYYADRFYDKLKEDNPKFFLNTGPMEPFCIFPFVHP
ncbi:PREDICTED: pancreatic lipase-related protein 3-like [Gekko japonicus]|uniref:Pancreatic lipase-related protein 3-like n=1 Tax=Gekko japonicus TaxID=146911 RepID=A0ABM1L3K6_GEKJA|nr:PREDICTED: pancreatic lipase-related protein 3-like [Gekko japonicus]